MTVYGVVTVRDGIRLEPHEHDLIKRAVARGGWVWWVVRLMYGARFVPIRGKAPR